jgi:CIC family chloride channel protein
MAGEGSIATGDWRQRAQRRLPIIDPYSTLALILISLLVGVVTGGVAVVFIWTIEAVGHFSFSQGLPDLLAFLGRGWIVAVPVLGALISGPMIAYWAIEAKGHGVPEVMQAIIMRAGRIRPRVAVVKSLASALCIGTGGSAGREGPIVQVGSALGSTAAQLLRLGTDRRVTLVACGAAAGIAATFNAPIAGVIFALEVILRDFTIHNVSSVVVSAVSASVISRLALGANPAFIVPAYRLHSAWELLFYAALSILAAIVGWAFVGVLYFFEDQFDRWRFPPALKPAVGAVGVGLIALLYPQALGAGLPIIEDALIGTLPVALLLGLLFAKLLATSFTLGSGNSGGIFSPSLFMGAMLGGAFGYLVHAYFPAITATPGAYALVGMASVFSAAAHAPLTAFLIVFEMSGDYRLILPLMVAVGLATLFSQTMRRESIYTLRLVKRGVPLERDRDIDLMRTITVGEVMTTDPDSVALSMSLQELAAFFARTHHHGFPVLDDQGRFVGIVTIQDLERAAARGPIVDLTVADIVRRDPIVVYPDDPLSKALALMSERDVGRLPVVDPDDPGKLVGLLRRQNIVRAYRHAILRRLENHHRVQAERLKHLAETEIVEIKISGAMKANGKTLKELPLPPQALITSIRRDDQIIIPHGDTRLQEGDVLIALCKPSGQERLKKCLLGQD